MRRALAALCLLALLCGCGAKSEADFVHGSAEALEGNILVVTLLASDPAWRWDREADAAALEEMNGYLRLAADYLTGAAAAYGKRARFTTDFLRDPALCYAADFPVPITDEGTQDELVWRYIAEEVPVEGLLKKYRADSVIFLLLINSDETCAYITCTRSWYEGMPCPYELVYLYRYDSGLLNCPAVYAHELLHTFGAWDYYMPDEAAGITEAFVAQAAELVGNDIMFTCSDPATGEYRYDCIPNDLGPLTAYYVGLTPRAALQETWSLAPSEHGESGRP